MKLNNLKISRQLNLGRGLILIFVLLLGIVSLLDSVSLWQITKDLYHHSLTTRQAIGSIQTDILYIRLEMNGLVLTNNEQNTQERLIVIDTYEADAFQQMDILYTSYLGPKNDIDNAYNSIVQYKAVRDETIRLLRVGNIDEAARRVKSDGVGGVQVQKVMADLSIINDFASAKANQFYMDVQQQKNQTFVNMIGMFVVILLLSGTIIILLRKSILPPLEELIMVTEAFQQGKLESRSRYESANEFGTLSRAFNAMTATVQSEIQNKEKVLVELNISIKQAETAKEIASNAGKYIRSLIEASLDPFVTIGLNGKITDVNYAGEQATGLPREKIIGTDFSEYFTEPEKAQAGFQQVLKDGKVVDYELNLKHISGDSIFVLFNASVYKDNKGQTIGVFAAARDFTATRRAEKYTRSLIEANLDQLIIIGRDGKITDVNYATEQATGLPREKIIGTDFSEYLTEPDKARAAYQQVLKDGKVVDYELNLKHISGTIIPFLYNASVYEDDEGQIVGVLAVARDISAIRKYENKLIDLNNNLESANKALETYSYSVSHDLKAPLRHIKGYLSLLIKKYIALLPEEGRHYLDNISYSAKNMEELIDGLLQFLKTGKTEMNQKLLDMNEIVDALIQPYREQDQQHRIEFHINPLPSAFGDLEMIKSVWSNLIDNAVKFTRKNELAKITIAAEQAETETIYHIIDNGAGFDMNHASNLFAVFQRLHSREDYDGMGIDLATIQRIITRHGGRIWAESKLGEGAAFNFTLMKRKKGE